MVQRKSAPRLRLAVLYNRSRALALWCRVPLPPTADSLLRELLHFFAGVRPGRGY